MTTISDSPSAAAGSTPVTKAVLDAVFNKIHWRLLPILLASYVIAYIDRINIGYAQLQMKQTLPWDTAVYGIGAGAFFIGYVIFEVPSNMLLEKIGARKTLLRIMCCWGLIAAAMMFVTTPTQFYVLRFLLGAFEAGFFPGVILYFTYWYPSLRRGQVIAIFMSAATLAGIFVGPLCGAILKYFNGVGGLHGWQWMFVVQGLPAFFLGLLVYWWLDDRPADAKWLSEREKALVADSLATDPRAATGGSGHGSLGGVLRDPKVWLLALVFMLLLGATYALVFWLPTLIQSWDVKDVMVIGLLSAIPYTCGAIGMILIGRNSDRRQERRWHYAICAFVAALGLGITAMLQGHLAGSLIAVSLAFVGAAAATPLFFTLISEYFSAAVAAAGIALISSLGNLGPAITPALNGYLIQRTGSNEAGIYMVMSLYLLSGLLLLVVARSPAKTQTARQVVGAT